MNSRKITFFGAKGSLEIYLPEDRYGIIEAAPTITSVKDIDSYNGKHPIYGLWESFCQDDAYNIVLGCLEIESIEFE